MLLPDGPLCGCGNRGCWEALASGTALAKLAAAKLESSAILQALAREARLNAELVVAAARQGDATALGLLAENGYYNALGIVNLVNAFDPEAIVIGGGLSFNGEWFFDPLEKALKKFRLLNTANEIKILRAGLRYDAGLLGAAALVLP